MPAIVPRENGQTDPTKKIGGLASGPPTFTDPFRSLGEFSAACFALFRVAIIFQDGLATGAIKLRFSKNANIMRRSAVVKSGPAGRSCRSVLPVAATFQLKYIFIRGKMEGSVLEPWLVVERGKYGHRKVRKKV